jgi:hypothetical protein
MRKVTLRQVQEAIVVYWVSVEVPDGLSDEELQIAAEEKAGDGEYEVVSGPEMQDLGEIIQQEIMENQPA